MIYWLKGAQLWSQYQNQIAECWSHQVKSKGTTPHTIFEHSLAQLGKAKVFSKLDANSGFWQIALFCFKLLQDLSGVVCMMDNILVYGQDQDENDIRQTSVLERLRQAKATLNKEKCSFPTQC